MNCECEDYEYEEYSNTKMSNYLTETYSNKTVQKICCDEKLMVIHFTDAATLTIEVEKNGEKIVPKCDNILDDVLHHLDSTHGLYCTDLEEPVKEEMFQLNNEDLIKKVKKLQEIVGGDFVPNKHCARLHITNTKEINELNKQVKELNKRLSKLENDKLDYENIKFSNEQEEKVFEIINELLEKINLNISSKNYECVELLLNCLEKTIKLINRMKKNKEK